MHFAAAAAFLLIAALQYNDPDPLYWMAVYGSTAAIAFATGMGHSRRLWAALTLGAVIGGLLIALPGFVDYVTSGAPNAIFADMSGPAYVEPAREFGGLLLAALLLGYYLKTQKR